MNKTELQKELAQLLRKVTELETRIDEMPDEVVGCMQMTEKPNKGQVYYSITGYAYICKEIWGDDKYDNARFLIGNSYATKEIAERALQRKQLQFREYQASVQSWIDVGETLDWNDENQLKHQIVYRHNEDAPDYHKRWKLHCDAPFPSKASAEKFINSLSIEEQHLLWKGEFYENN